MATVNADPEGPGVGSSISLKAWTEGRPPRTARLPPYVFGPGFEVYEPPGQDRRIVVLWLVPITSPEARFVRRQGAQAFEELMQRSEANVVDPRRAPIV